ACFLVINCVLADIAWLSFTHMLIRISVFFIICLTHLYIRIKQNLSALYRATASQLPSGGRCLWQATDRFIERNIRNFEILFFIKSVHSNAFLYFILSNLPSNIYLVTLIGRGKVHGLAAKFILNSFAGQQLICILWLHVTLSHL